jgi:hypothetical protein
MYAHLLYFVILTAGKYKLLRALVLYLWISLLKLNKCLGDPLSTRSQTEYASQDCQDMFSPATGS